MDDLGRLRRRTRSMTRSAWFPLTLFGGLLILSAPLCEVAQGQALAVFWIIAGPLATIVVTRYFRSRGLRLGADVAPTPYVIASVIVIVAAFALGPVLALPAGLLLFAALDRSLALAVTAAGTGLGGLGLELSGLAANCLLVEALYGTALLVAGSWFRRAEAKAH